MKKLVLASRDPDVGQTGKDIYKKLTNLKITEENVIPMKAVLLWWLKMTTLIAPIPSTDHLSSTNVSVK